MDVKSMDPGRQIYRETTTNRVVHVAVLYCGHGSGDERSKIAIVVISFLPFRAPQSTLMSKILRLYAWRRGGTTCMGPEWDIQVESWRHSSNLESYEIERTTEY
jgi:hypothetical protein